MITLGLVIDEWGFVKRSEFFAGAPDEPESLRERLKQLGGGKDSTVVMDAGIAAYIGYSVGGTGKANAIGTFVGAILMGILQNGLVMVSVPYYAMDIIKGVVLALALALTYFKKK